MPKTGPVTDAGQPDRIAIERADIAYAGYFRIDRYTLRHRKHDGTWSGSVTREVFERGHAVAVLPYDRRDDAVILIEQLRAGALAAGKSPWQIEVIAGIIDPGETPEAVAHREAQEESDLVLHHLTPLYHYLVSPGGSSETVRLYAAAADSRRAGGVHGLDAEHEDILVRVMPFTEAWSLVDSGRIDNAPTIMALQWLALNRERLPAPPD